MSTDRFGSLSEDQLDAIHAACSRLQESWKNGRPLSIEQVLSDSDEVTRDVVLREVVACEIGLRRSRGEQPCFDDYFMRFPDQKETIENAFGLLNVTGEETEHDGELTRTVVFDDTSRTVRRTAMAAVQGQTDKSNSKRESREASDDFSSGTPFGRYLLLRLLGKGGMGRVYLAHDLELDRRVAIKFPDFDKQQENAEVAIERFRREARSMATVQHPNICPIFDVGQHEGRHYLTMAYVEGQCVSDAASSLTQDEIVQVVKTTAKALQAVHEAGVVHRDLKPSNVMLNAHGEPIVMDFGLASRDAISESGITQSGLIIGSPAYMAPEQVEARHEEIGPRTDVYALGVILYQLLTGRRPFDGKGLSILGQISSGARPEPPSVLTDVNAVLEAICLKAMSHKIDDRYKSAEALSQALDDYQQSRMASSEHRERSRRPMTAGITCASLLLLALALVTINWPKNQPQDSRSELAVTTAHDAVGEPHASGGEIAGGWQPGFVESVQPFDSDTSHAVAAGDLDGDNDIDVVIAREDAPSHVLLNDGTGTFSRHQELTSFSCQQVVLADVDSDGDLDAALVGLNLDGPAEYSGAIWLNDGEGTFTESETKLPGQFPWDLVFADLDGDRDLDAVVACWNGPDFVLTNDGEGNFADSGQRLGATDSSRLAIGDIDQDGDPDLFVGNYSDEPDTVWLNDGTGHFVRSGQWLGQSTSNGVALTDLDYDGDLDAYVANVDQPDNVWINDGTGFFRRGQLTTESLTSCRVEVADLNGDHSEDLFVINGFRGTAQPGQILLSTAEPETMSLLHTPLVTGGDIALADFNGDDTMDIFVATRPNAPNRLWFSNPKSSGEHTDTKLALSEWAVPEPAVNPFAGSVDALDDNGSAFAVAGGDFDGDGDVDALVANHGRNVPS